MKASKGKKRRRKLPLTEEELIESLLARKQNYERYFDSVTEHDHKAEQAYAALIKTLIDILRKREPEEDSIDMRQAAAEILEAEYGIPLK